MLQLNQLERHVLARRQEIAVFLAAGADGLEQPVWEEEREAFDDLLASNPKVSADPGLRLLRDLGVA